MNRNEVPQSLSAALRVNEVCDRFELAWQAGQRPRIEDFLAELSEPEQAALLLELVALEIAYRRQAGDDFQLEEYGARFPRLELPATLLDRTRRRPERSPAGASLPAVPGYEILRVLGRGGMGVVYQGRHLGLKRLVALKMILAGAHASPEQLARFQREAEAVAQLQHPHIVQIYEVGAHEGRPYFSLEYVDGGSLAQRLDGTPWPAQQAGSLAETLARAMHAAHQRGIVHRDLKPGNVLLTATGIPKITDFGLVKRLDDQPGLTQSNAVVGTPSYMAPEQAAGKVKMIGPAADVYALGAILYQLLTGRPPFQAQTPLETLAQVQAHEPVPPRRLQPKVLRDLETICLKCLEKEPSKRYTSAAALADDLHRFLDAKPIVARPTPAWERALKWARRRPVAAALLVVSALAAGALGGVGVAVLDNARLQHAFKATEAAHYFHRILLADRERVAHHLTRADQLLDECPADFRHWEWHHLRRLCHTHLLTIQGAAGNVAFSPDGQRLASAGAGFTLKIWDAVTGRVLLVLRGHTAPVRGLAFSPDGGRLASAGDRTVRVWDSATGRETMTFQDHALVRGVAFSPNGQHLASASEKGMITLWDLTTGQQLFTLPGHAGAAQSVAFGPDGRRLAYASDDHTVKLWDIATRQLALTLDGHTGAVYSLAFTPDGGRLASGGQDRSLKLWDLATGKELRTLPAHDGAVLSVAVSPDGRRLASAGDDWAVKVWDTGTGQEALTLLGHTAWVRGLAFSPDGQRLASASDDRTARVWDMLTGKEPMTLRGHTRAASSVAFSPNCRYLASASYDRTVKLWDPATGRELQTLRGHTKYVAGVAISPDGQRLASAGGDWTVRVWETATGREIFTLRGHSDLVSTVAFSPDGQRLASASSDKTVKVWDLATGQEMLTLSPHTDAVLGVAYSPDGRWLASAGYEKAVRIWEATTGREIFTLRGHTADVHGLAFSPDGRRLASASADRTVKVWDCGSGKELLSLQAHSGMVFAVRYSPDGRRLASAGGDRTVRIWDATTGQEALTLEGAKDAFSSVAFSPDGQYLAAASRDGSVTLWSR
jgi:WD40 repeat protein